MNDEDEKTDWRFFFSTLSDACLNEILDCAHHERTKRDKEKCESGVAPALSAEEMALVASGKYIPAIRDYRIRTKVELMQAKLVVDSYRDKLFPKKVFNV